MKIIILTESFPPETKSQSTLFYELAESFVGLGHRVSVITRRSRYNLADGVTSQAVPAKEKMGEIDVIRLQTPPLARNIPLIRGFEHFLLAVIFFLGGLKIKDVDSILVYSPPLPLALAGYWLGRLKKRPVLVNIQDLYPQTVIDLGLLKNKFLIKLMKKMEKFIYKRSDCLIAHSEANGQYFISQGAQPEMVEVVHNWVDLDKVKSGHKINPFSQKYQLTDKFVVSFAGSMGFAQGLEVIVQAADILRDKREIQFVLVGDGVMRERLQAEVAKLGLQNVLFIATQPVNIYPLILNSSEISLITLAKGLVTPIPGKLASIMAAGVPLIASVPLSGEGPKIIKENNCGVCTEAGNPAELAKEILNLYNKKSLREELGRNGRRAAEKYFSRQTAIFKYQQILAKVIRNKHV